MIGLYGHREKLIVESEQPSYAAAIDEALEQNISLRGLWLDFYNGRGSSNPSYAIIDLNNYLCPIDLRETYFRRVHFLLNSPQIEHIDFSGSVFNDCFFYAYGEETGNQKNALKTEFHLCDFSRVTFKNTGFSSLIRLHYCDISETNLPRYNAATDRLMKGDVFFTGAPPALGNKKSVPRVRKRLDAIFPWSHDQSVKERFTLNAIAPHLFENIESMKGAQSPENTREYLLQYYQNNLLAIQTIDIAYELIKMRIISSDNRDLQELEEILQENAVPEIPALNNQTIKAISNTVYRPR
ncbi:MAG: hypothetical protein ACOYK8_00950 [Alphaproteobacteria bacterium]